MKMTKDQIEAKVKAHENQVSAREAVRIKVMAEREKTKKVKNGS